MPKNYLFCIPLLRSIVNLGAWLLRYRIRGVLCAVLSLSLILCGESFAQTQEEFDEDDIKEDVVTQASDFRPRTRIRIGLLDFESEASYASTRDKVQPAIVEYIRKQFPNYTIEARYCTTPELTQAVKNGEVEFFLASSGFYVAMFPYGVRDVATLVSDNFPNPNRVVSGTMFVRRDRANLSTLKSIQGLRAVSTHPLNFMTYQINLGEIALAGYDPDKFFSSVEFTDNDPKKVMERVLTGDSDVGLLRHCMLEAITATHPEMAGQFKVIHSQERSPMPCASSTALYPGWTMAVTSHTPANIAADLAKSLLLMKPEDTPTGYTWSLATDFKRVNHVLRLLRTGPYSYLREWTVKDIIIKAWPYLGFFVGLLVAGIIHQVRVKKLVIRRTQQLSDALQREREADERAREMAARLDSMQRVSAIGQLSSIFVHELGQPLTAMRYSVRGLDTLFKRLAPQAQTPSQSKSMASCIEILNKQLVRCAEIIDRVRSYAKHEGGREDAVNFRDVVNETVQEFKDARKAPECLKLTLPLYPLVVEGNAVELKLIVLNLLKNAADEVANTEGQKQTQPVLDVSLTHDEQNRKAVFAVENSGRKFSEDDVKRLKEPFKTSKSKGLGLGIMIVTSIAEAHRAQVEFSARQSGGLSVRFVIDIREDKTLARPDGIENTEFGDRF